MGRENACMAPEGRHTLNPLGSGKERRRALEGRSEAWPLGYQERKPNRPIIPTVRGWRHPRSRKNSQACRNNSVDCRRPRNDEHEQDGEQKKRDHPAHPCKQQRLVIRKAQYKQAEQLLRGCPPVALRLCHMPSHASNCTPQGEFIRKAAPWTGPGEPIRAAKYRERRLPVAVRDLRRHDLDTSKALALQ
jgi:hypothetical protein